MHPGGLRSGQPPTVPFRVNLPSPLGPPLHRTHAVPVPPALLPSTHRRLVSPPVRPGRVKNFRQSCDCPFRRTGQVFRCVSLKVRTPLTWLYTASWIRLVRVLHIWDYGNLYNCYLYLEDSLGLWRYEGETDWRTYYKLLVS